MAGRGGLVVGFAAGGFQVRNTIQLKIRLECGSVARYIIGDRSNVLPLVWCGSLERECQLRCRHLTTVQNDEIHPKIARALLQKGTLI
ncbi:hypothetical protein AVEN_200996-1 [Araneus ventricosus]|uniref:Uncharacterized protein n=1 Tax=Araneus ventricosus TaxID=182803 RepID=A0A4Y2QPG6_ARAVE|nr:hypothetical protein AVEN_200996-1 [Araneus ventricosus]